MQLDEEKGEEMECPCDCIGRRMKTGYLEELGYYGNQKHVHEAV